ncbi:hypothetical protein KFU94_41650 [Chloroflexi bacterium TSY]|nr:hypothetical protein [Chloroflexi bacterium TSY]
MSMSKRIIQIIIVSTLIVVQVDSYAPVLAAPEAQGASALGRIMLRAFGKASSIATSQTNTAAGLALLAKENVSTDDLRKWRQEYPEEFRQLKMSETEWESLLEKDRAFLIPQSLQPSQQSRRFTADCATASDMRSCISALATRRIALIPVTIEGNEESIQNQAASSGQEPSLTNEINAEECLPNSVNISNVMGDIHESLIASRDIIINSIVVF